MACDKLGNHPEYFPNLLCRRFLHQNDLLRKTGKWHLLWVNNNNILTSCNCSNSFWLVGISQSFNKNHQIKLLIYQLQNTGQREMGLINPHGHILGRRFGIKSNNFQVTCLTITSYCPLKYSNFRKLFAASFVNEGILEASFAYSSALVSSSKYLLCSLNFLIFLQQFTVENG
ncbi:MAG: hypothetical protein IPF54_26805 [Draconibacterium sp.]|nr:hypothetical protein [Draconibacterium sp.]